jgi:signal transduction histidine kinase
MKFPLTEAAKAAALAVVYLLAARMGLELGTVSGFATLVWPPTGIAIAALLLGGYRLWPGIFIGALAANVWNGAPVTVGLGIATGNTLEALVAVYLLHRLPDFRVSLDRVRDAVGLVVLAAALAPVLSATIGTATLELAGLVPAGQLGEHWRAWWLGDAIGALLIAPAILVWASKPTFTSAPRLLEAGALGALVVLASIFVFVIPEQGNSGLFSQSYVFFPLLIWAAIRFGQHGAVSTTLLVSIIAVWGTAIGKGPFVDSTLHASLFALQTYMGVTAATFLILGASTAERDRVRNDLSIAHDVAAKANRAKADFLAVMSHELRTPLNAIAGYAEILSVGVAGTLNEKQGEAVSRIQRSQEHLLSLIDDVLTFAKIEAGTSQLYPRAVRVVDAFEGLEPLVEPDLARKQIVLGRDIPEPSIQVHADPNKLRQILLNIVGNAIKFTPSGGSIILGATRSTDNVVLTVTDTGIGVPTDKLSQVFEPFFQVDTGTTREYSGVGLGLAIARDLARAMGGEVQFDSTVGQGSVVSVVLPAANAG